MRIARTTYLDEFDVIIAHDDALARAHLQSLLPSAVTVGDVGSFGSLVDALKDSRNASLIILDWNLPGLAGDVGVRYLASHFPGIKLIVLYSHVLDLVTNEFLADQVWACIPKETDDVELRRTFRSALKGEGYKPRQAPTIAALEADMHDMQRNFLEHELTGRQVEVLRLLAHGHPNREIANRLHISQGTVKVHVNALFRSLGVHNRVSAAAAWARLFDEHERRGRH